METRDHRADMMRLLRAEKPDIDVDDDNAVFGQIIDDYADYARLLDDERMRREAQKRRDELAEQTGATFGAGQAPEMAEAARKWLDNVAAAVNEGNYSAEAFGMAVKAMNYDRDVEAAEVRGRNARINAAMMEPIRGDGVPKLGASTPAPTSGLSIFDIALMR